MHHTILLVLSLLFLVTMLVMLGEKLRISYPIFLVIAGLLLSFIPGIPRVEINPEIVFSIFLPPLLYEAAWFTSWKDFWKWKRPISLLAFGLVIFTSCIIAYLSEAMIPNFTLALGFLLGGIISPPDAVAATSVLKGLSIPKRFTTILEGESLVNDASSLIVFRFALAAVLSGTFVLEQAATNFFLVTLLGIAAGLGVALVFYAIHRWLPTTPSIDVLLTFMAPYFMYLVAEHFHVSGVMAVVSGGLFLSYHSMRLLNFQSRIQSTSVWSSVVFVMHGIIFILIGLELPIIIDELGDYSLQEAIIYGLVISAATILVRFIWVYPIAHIPRFLSKKIREREPSPGWKGPLVISWAGMRGVISLAAALSIPTLLTNEEVFPQRNLILFITFVVILVTLVFQGLTLPLIIRWINLEEIDEEMPDAEQEAAIKLRLARAAIRELEEKYPQEVQKYELLNYLREQLESDISVTSRTLECLTCNDEKKLEVEVHKQVMQDLFRVQRKELFLMRREKIYSDEHIRRQESILDLDEARVHHHHHHL